MSKERSETNFNESPGAPFIAAPDGPITLSYPRPEMAPEQRREWLEKVFAAIDAAYAAGETFELERDFSAPVDRDLF